jgi:hypothetical protein
MKIKLMSTVLLVTLFVNCSDTTTVFNRTRHQSDKPIITGSGSIDGTLPNYSSRCLEIKYLNKSSKSIHFNSYQNLNIILSSGEKASESGVNTNEDIVKGFCKKIASNNGIDLDFGINPRKKLCVCVLGGTI